MKRVGCAVCLESPGLVQPDQERVSKIISEPLILKMPVGIAGAFPLS